MKSRKAAALAGVFYYLSQESREISIGGTGSGEYPAPGSWKGMARLLSDRLNQALQTRGFRKPYGNRPVLQSGPGKPAGSAPSNGIQRSRFPIFLRTAGKRNFDSRNNWKARS